MGRGNSLAAVFFLGVWGGLMLPHMVVHICLTVDGVASYRRAGRERGLALVAASVCLHVARVQVAIAHFVRDFARARAALSTARRRSP